MLLTIGHGAHPIEEFLALLQRHQVAVLVDVRSRPMSRFAPWFNQLRLATALAQAGIAYDARGDALGARSADPACYVDDRASYARIAATDAFRAAADAVAARARTQRSCLLCAERDPLVYHRTFLVGVRLRHARLPLAHILADGSLETQAETEERLLAHHRLADDGLLWSHEERLAEAYRRHEQELAYRRPSRTAVPERRATRTRPR